MLKVSLIVVKGKPEGKEIPLETPVFVVGRDEGCHLRPNSVEVSRRHAEIVVSEDAVIVRDLGSRNGTKVNGKLLKGPQTLKSGELLQVGPLTFAVSIRGSATAAVAPTERPPGAGKASLDDVPQDAIDSWLISDSQRPTPDRPSGVYDGETLTIEAYTGQANAKDETKVEEPEEEEEPKSVYDNLEFEQLEEGAGDVEIRAEGDEAAGDAEAAEGDDAGPEVEMIDESNPFYAARKAQQAAAAGGTAATAGPSKASYKDSSDAANDILRKMLERRRASR
jgi:pSer/pThr/pTyr-binding forkhead associated (FHA) protein